MYRLKVKSRSIFYMANYYDKNHILKSPELEPKRHYESSGTFSTQGGDNNKNQQDNEDFSDHPLYSILDKLYKMRAMGKLLPDPESKIFENVNESLIRFTQGLVIDSFENPVIPEYSKPKTNDERYYSTNVEENESDVDIFGENINYDIEIEDQESLYSLSYNAFIRDYNDVAREYTSSMEQVIHRFFQSMLTIADDAEMPDYTYLMESFDGNAVKVNDKDLLHARDYIVKLQRIRESDTRLMQKEFTAENTLIRGRGWLSAEKQRERYLKANYKVNTSSLCATMGNNALFESRASAEEQYNQAMTNMYKYLNSSAITMGDALDKRINEGALKGELALNGIDIYEKTPEPLPADTSGLDMKSTSDVEDALGKAIDDNAKDFQVNDNGGGGSEDGSIAIENVGPAKGKGVENIPSDAEQWTVDMAKECSQLCGIPADWLWCHWRAETGFKAENCPGTNNWGCVKSEDGWVEKSSPSEWAKYFARYITGNWNPNPTQAKTLYEYVKILQEQVDGSHYCYDDNGSTTAYYNKLVRCLGNKGTVL